MIHWKQNPHRLKKRRQFLKTAQAGNKQVSPAFVVQYRRRDETDLPMTAEGLGLGFTASKKVGNAVQRNKAKRRLRALSRDCLSAEQTAAQSDMVLIARKAVLKRPFRKLKRDFNRAISSLDKG